jgi:hypothetical protein
MRKLEAFHNIVGILGYFIQWRALVIVGVLLIILVVCYVITKMMIGVRAELGAKSDARMKLTTEMIQGTVFLYIFIFSHLLSMIINTGGLIFDVYALYFI